MQTMDIMLLTFAITRGILVNSMKTWHTVYERGSWQIVNVITFCTLNHCQVDTTILKWDSSQDIFKISSADNWYIICPLHPVKFTFRDFYLICEVLEYSPASRNVCTITYCHVETSIHIFRSQFDFSQIDLSFLPPTPVSSESDSTLGSLTVSQVSLTRSPVTASYNVLTKRHCRTSGFNCEDD